ncbi:uncharacterized protein LOC143907294 [Temnothorax americanus]|uniref:uncharacterized protein LOC143907294 n=1 Tax=Temnothorax americanus TaxID=1964332 RepID=UPI004069879D
MNMDYAAPSNHDVSNEVEISSNIPKSLLSSDSEQTAQVEAGLSLEEKNGHLQPTLQSARVVANLSLEKENQMLRSQIDKMKTAMESFLNSEQIEMLQEGRQEGRRPHWSPESIIKSLKFRLALSVHGYDFLRSTGYPLPAYSTGRTFLSQQA